jgi:hypothetical protein
MIVFGKAGIRLPTRVKVADYDSTFMTTSSKLTGRHPSLCPALNIAHEMRLNG